MNILEPTVGETIRVCSTLGAKAYIGNPARIVERIGPHFFRLVRATDANNLMNWCEYVTSWVHVH